MARHNLSLKAGLGKVRKARPIVLPNQGFHQQLQQFEKLGCDYTKWTPWQPSLKKDSLMAAFDEFITESQVPAAHCEHTLL